MASKESGRNKMIGSDPTFSLRNQYRISAIVLIVLGEVLFVLAGPPPLFTNERAFFRACTQQ